MSDEATVGIRVSCDLVSIIKKLLNFSKDMPANFAVDAALRELKERLEKEQASKMFPSIGEKRKS